MASPMGWRSTSLPGWTAIVLASVLPALFPLLHHDSSDRISKVWITGLLLLCTTAFASAACRRVLTLPPSVC